MKYALEILKRKESEKEGLLDKLSDMECEFMCEHSMRKVTEQLISDLKKAVNLLELNV